MTCQDLYHSFPLLFCYNEGISFLLPKANFTTCALDPTGPDFLGTLVYPLFLLFCTFRLSFSPDSSLSALKLSTHLYYLKKKKKKALPQSHPSTSLSLPSSQTSLASCSKLTTSSFSRPLSPHSRKSASHHHHSIDKAVCLQDPLTSAFISNPAGTSQSLSNFTSAELDSAHHNYLLG